MSARKLLLSAALLAPLAVQAATPATGELTTEAPTLTWTGDGPYLFNNLTPFVGDPVPVYCDTSLPQICDEFQFTVNIPDEFRDLEENKKETVSISILFPDTSGQEDYDLYVYDAAGTLVGSSAGSAPQTSEKITVPLRTLKNGAYTVQVIPFTPIGTNYDGTVQLGKPGAAKSSGSGPLAGSFGFAALFGLLGLGALRRRR